MDTPSSSLAGKAEWQQRQARRMLRALETNVTYQATSGDLKNDVCYWGDHTFATHLFRLAKIQNLNAHLTIGEAPTLPNDRKAAAMTLHSEVSRLLNANFFCMNIPALPFHPFRPIWMK